MFLLWISIAIILGVLEEIKLSWDAYKHPHDTLPGSPFVSFYPDENMQEWIKNNKKQH